MPEGAFLVCANQILRKGVPVGGNIQYVENSHTTKLDDVIIVITPACALPPGYTACFAMLAACEASALCML